MGQDFQTAFQLDSELLPTLAARIDSGASHLQRKWAPEPIRKEAKRFCQVYKGSEARKLRDAYEHRADWILDTPQHRERRGSPRLNSDPTGTIVRSTRGLQSVVSISAFGTTYEFGDLHQAALALWATINGYLLE